MNWDLSVLNNNSPKWRWIVVDTTDTEVNNCFSICHTSWIISGPVGDFICDNIPTKAILFFFVCSEVNSTWLITSELTKQRSRKVLFTCVVYLQVNALSEWIIGIYLHEFTNNERALTFLLFKLNTLQTKIVKLWVSRSHAVMTVVYWIYTTAITPR